MIQQINLYQDEFHDVGSRVNRSFVAGGVLLVLIFAGSGAYQASTISGLEDELNAKNSEIKSLEQSYNALEKSVKPRAMDMNLAERVLKAKRTNDEKLRAKNYLSGDGAGNATGFSSLLQGLGRKRDKIENLWLKNIVFSDGGFDLRLVGSNYRPELLPEFIQALNDEDLYRDREFREIKITRSIKNNKVMDFILATRSMEDKSGVDENSSDKTLFMARLKRISEEEVAR